ncbi:HAAS signaling domain-containing protein [Staphylococcus debuckii]|uniref:DUF1700 domain-containing protein n=1 Tax=Staphylococcus debuckii TaxID=2044912 RepID=A0ABU9F0H4_9STAP|nr:DUF1700 domain-containing protein [Staphylococcus debuckii]AYU54032.1 DUF1700 domain-containing protein [Staphylococcus debuckii]
MSKQEYLRLLDRYLTRVTPEERRDILDEYETHFISGKEAGKSEDEIAKELGNPKYIGREMSATAAMDKAESSKNPNHVTNAVLAVMGLSILNFFVVIVVLTTLIGLLFGLITATATLLVSPVLLLVKGFIDGFGTIIPLDIYSVFALFGVGLMLLVITYLACKWSFILFMKYLRWNIDVVKGSARS